MASQLILHQQGGTVLEDLRYTYDGVGNRLSYSRLASHPPLPAEVQAAHDAANQMTQFQAATPNLEYDANGNLIRKTTAVGTTTYTWDSRNQLVGLTGPGLTASFKYDALGRRIEKTINGQTTQYLYDGLDIVAELQNGQVVASYLRSLNIDEPFSRTKGGTTSYYLQDALGSVIGLADATGTLTATYAYDAFGAVTQSGAASDQPFKYTGREDDGTGLFYYRARYYSPEIRRFISQDPIGLLGGDINLYAYVQNNPLVLVDPLGLKNVIINYIPGPDGTLVPIVYNTDTGQTTIGFPNNYTDPITNFVRTTLEEGSKMGLEIAVLLAELYEAIKGSPILRLILIPEEAKRWPLGDAEAAEVLQWPSCRK